MSLAMPLPVAPTVHTNSVVVPAGQFPKNVLPVPMISERWAGSAVNMKSVNFSPVSFSQQVALPETEIVNGLRFIIAVGVLQEPCGPKKMLGGGGGSVAAIVSAWRSPEVASTKHTVSPNRQNLNKLVFTRVPPSGRLNHSG